MTRYDSTMSRGCRSKSGISRLACVVTCVAILFSRADAATYTWSGGNGTWNTTSLNWNTGAIAWPNVVSPADNATFTGSNSVTLASGTINVNTITTATAGLSFTGAGAANSTLAFTGTGAKVTPLGSNNNTGVAFSNLTIDTGSGLTLLQIGASTPFTFGSGVVVTGTGAVTLDKEMGSVFGAGLNLTTTNNSSFTGGFIAKGGTRTRRLAAITGTTAGAFGSGAAMATGDGARLVYSSGAQSAVNGVVAGLTASSGGNIFLSGSFGNSSRDRFTVTSGAMLTGSTSQLSQVRRVSSFSASPTQAEAILAEGATLVVSTNNVNVDTALSAMTLGTSRDLYFGLGANFNSVAFAITVGASTPWRGFSTDGNIDGTGTINRVLSSGTVTVNTGGGAFSELLFQSLGVDGTQISNISTQITLGAAAAAPTFVKNGSGDIVARVTPFGRLNLDNASVGTFFSRYAVDASGALFSTRTNAINGKDVSLSAATFGVSGAASQSVTDTVGTLAFSDVSAIAMQPVAATGATTTLTLTSLDRSGLASLTVGGTALSGAQKVYIPADLQRGKMVVPYMVGNGSGSPEFLYIDASANNLGLIRWNTQGVAYDSAWGQGNVVLASSGNGNLAIPGTVSADSFQFSANLTGSGTIQLGMLANGSRAAQAGIISAANDIAIAPAIDLGTAELVLWNDRGSTRFATFNGALTTSGGLSKNGSGIGSLASASNNITGAIAINQGMLRIAGGNGLGDAATVYVASPATFDISGANEQVALLTGSGTVAIASARTLTVSGTGNGEFAGAISGAGGFAKGGSGVLTLAGSNSFAGALAVQNGTLQFSSLASGSGAQGLGAGAAVNLGVAATSSGEIDYRGSGGTLDKNVFALGNGRNRIRNSGAGTLALSGTLTKNGTILELAGGAFTVSGRITGASANSDLFINGANVTLTNTTNDYNGPTYVFGGGSLTLGASNVIPAGSNLILGGTGSDTGSGALTIGTFTDTIASLTTSSAGATLAVSVNGATAGSLAMGNLTFGAGADTLAVSMSSPTAVRYTIMTYTGNRSGTFDTVTGNGNYNVVYGGDSNGTVDLQLKANQASTFTLTPAATRVLVGGSTQFTGSLVNTSPAGAASLAWNPTSTGSLAASGFTSSLGSMVAAGSTSSVTAWVAAGNTAGSQTWSIANTDANAITAVGTASGSLEVYDAAVASFISGTASGATWLVDVGAFNLNTGSHTAGFSIFNLLSDPTYTADLRLLSVTDIGTPSASLSIDLTNSAFGDLAAGNSSSWLATLLSTTGGAFSNSYNLAFTSAKSGQAVGDSQQNITLTVTGVIVVPEPGAIVLAGIGIAAAAHATRRRRR